MHDNLELDGAIIRNATTTQLQNDAKRMHH